MHKRVWFKIHWILGVIVGVFLLLIGVSGAILSFQKEITRFINQDSLTVTVPQNVSILPIKELLENFQAKFPQEKIDAITFSSDEKSSFIISVVSTEPKAKGGKKYYINPYNGEILPSFKGDEFFTFIRAFHRWFALEGDLRAIGKQIVAISTICLIILCISGLIIYFPRVKRAFFKSFIFSFKHKKRALLSTMHSAVGIWVLIFYLVASLTGLYWSYEWYRNMLYKIANVEQVAKKTEKKVIENYKADFENYEKAILLFNNFVQKEYKSASVTFPEKGTLYRFSYLDLDATHFRQTNILEVDINTQKVLKHDRFEDLKISEQLIKSILPLHSGEYFGIVGQTLMFISCLLMILFTVTGYMLYFDRYKRKSLKIKG